MDRKVCYKSYSSCRENNNIQAQVVKAVGKQIDIEDPVCMKYDAGTSFQSIVCMLIFDIVTIKRNSAVLQRYENNHCITTTKEQEHLKYEH